MSLKKVNYTLGGKEGEQHQLLESDDMVVVRTKGNVKLKDALSSASSKSALAKMKVEEAYKAANVTVLKIDTDSPDKIAARDKARKSFNKQKEVRFAGRVFVDKNTHAPVLYTENFFVKFHDKITEAECLKTLASFGLEIKEKVKYAPNSYFVQAKEGTGLEVFAIAQKLLKRKSVEFCHPELIRQSRKKKINPKQWHLDKTTINGKAINAHANVGKAHAISTGKDVIIAVIDDGVDIQHEEFSTSGKIVFPRDATLKTNNPMPKKADENHGTACAGVACASGKKASGVAPDAKLMPIRLVSGLGSQREADAFVWAVDNGADVISCSWGPQDGEPEDTTDPLHKQSFKLPDSTRLAMKYALEKGRNGKGCIITYAAGNGNESADLDGYASSEYVIPVAASNDTDKRSIYSDYGKCVWVCFPSSDWGNPDFDHPESLTKGIYTTDRVGAKGYNKQNYVSDFGGTSSACPGVAGVCALILSVNPALTQPQVKAILKDTATQIDKAKGNYKNGHSEWYGYGKVNAEKAVKKAKQTN